MSKKHKINTEYDKSTLTYLKEIGSYPSLTQQEEYTLWHKYKYEHDLNAKDKLIKSNLKFVVNVAKNYQGLGLSYADLIAEGNIGLMKGLDRFDGERGYKLISYSVWWIKQTIKEALNERNSSDVDDLPEDNLNPDIDFMPDNEENDVKPLSETWITEDIHDTAYTEEKVGYLMNFLNDREKFIIKNYWGLEGNEPMTLDDIGLELGLTKERVRQISERCMLRLRNTMFDK